jgi:HD-GYP domain-containing protein (c-di-GMP phosphodiesterase class II)
MPHQDILASLNDSASLKERMVHCHQVVRGPFPFIERIAVCLYDAKTTLLKTYVHSSGEDDPLSNYQAPLEEAPSLKRILEEGHPRVVNNLVTFEDGPHEHTQRVGRAGYAASYTLPMFYQGGLLGFIFFNSRRPDVFAESVLNQLDVYAHLISLMVVDELSTLRALTAALGTVSHITHERDPETGSHLDRMSRYARLIAKELAERHRLDDTYIEHVFMFSPLHDLGKVGIPDRVLLKPGRLDPEERAIMNTHSSKGREMIDHMVANFGLGGLQHIDILRNIAEYHHEAVDGSGYPEGRRGEAIPLEARIVAVADVFDALTSRRPYKAAWSNDAAFSYLMRVAGGKLDRECVQALLDQREEVELIQQRFAENPLG